MIGAVTGLDARSVADVIVTGGRRSRCFRSTTRSRLVKISGARHAARDATLETRKSRAIERENGGARGAIGQRV